MLVIKPLDQSGCDSSLIWPLKALFGPSENRTSLLTSHSLEMESGLLHRSREYEGNRAQKQK